MPFERPSLTDLIERNKADLAARLPGADTALRRGNIQVLARTHAGAVHGLYGYQDFIAKQILPDTAEAEFLERHAVIWGINRKPAARAAGSVTLTGTVGAVIPAGAALRRSDGARYMVTAAATFTGTSAAVSVQAEDTGAAGNTDVGALVSLVSPVTGVVTVGQVAEGGLAGGADQETDAALAGRILTRIQKPPHGGAQGDYTAWALEVPGVTRAWAYPGWLGVGTVGVTFVMDGRESIIPLAGDVELVAAHIEPLRPVTAAVTVFAPTPLPVDFTLSVSPDTAAVRAAVEAELADLIAREAEPGSTLLLSHVREAVSTATGEADHAITAPAADVAAGPGELITLGGITWS